MPIFLNRGNQEFKDVVNSKLYVDKTDMIEFINDILCTEQRYVCVSRPRRFGKSITANMLGAYYDINCDSKALFEEKKLGKIPGWDRYLNSFDTIRIDLAGIRSRSKDGSETLDYIENSITSELKEEYPDYVYPEVDGIADILAKLNDKTGKRFVIIIDEWDCLFRDDKKDVKVQNRYINLLRSLFKDNRSKNFLALAYITGILPIKKYNSESALNNFYEYTMITPFKLSKYTGFLEEEVIELCKKYGMDYKEARDWYDGYSFPGIEHIYGPNSIVKAMFNQWYDNYWSQTVAYNSLSTYITMNFDGLKDAIKLMLGDQRLNVKVGQFQNDMVSFNSKDDVLTALIHLGYLAYDSEREEAYIPNREVRMCFEQTLEYAGWKEVKMNVVIEKYSLEDLPRMIDIWNEVVEEGIAFPQEDFLDSESGKEFFESQTYTGVARGEDGKVYGLYILHPNNVGRCGHICNASYAVDSEYRGLHIGEKLVLDCISQGKEAGFKVLQFNAVVASNIHARHLYERLGFRQLGTIPGGFRLKNGQYEDICPYYRVL